MFNLVLLLPFLSSTLLLTNRHIGTFETAKYTLGFISLTFGISLYILYSVAFTGETLIYFLPIWTWFDLEFFNLISLGIINLLCFKVSRYFKNLILNFKKYFSSIFNDK